MSEHKAGFENTMGLQDVPTNYQLDRRVSVLEQTMIRVHTDLEQINKNLSRLVWLMITAIMLAVMKWLLVGGSTLPV